MNSEFANLLSNLQPLCDRLRTMAPVSADDLPTTKVRGVYAFSENDKVLYVGRSNHIGRRCKQHWQPGSRLNDAPFAVLLARQTTGILPTYSGDLVRKKLIEHDGFMTAFKEAKERIRQMEFRFVEEPDPIRQTLLEVYCAVSLKSPYNKFDVS